VFPQAFPAIDLDFFALKWRHVACFLQAAIGPVALDNMRQRGLGADDPETRLAEDLLTVAVLVILITAPIGAAAIMLSAPKLLNQQSSPAARTAEEGEEEEKSQSG